MPTSNVVLTGYQEQFIANLVDSRRYKNTNEAIRVFERKENEGLTRIQALHDVIAVGEADFMADRYNEYSSELLNRLAGTVKADFSDKQ